MDPWEPQEFPAWQLCDPLANFRPQTIAATICDQELMQTKLLGCDRQQARSGGGIGGLWSSEQEAWWEGE